MRTTAALACVLLTAAAAWATGPVSTQDPLLLAQTMAMEGKKLAGEVLPVSYASPHPYPGSATGEEELVWSQVIEIKGATYVQPRFSRLELAPGDRVVVREPLGEPRFTHTGAGPAERGRTGDGFFSTFVPGETAVVELWSSNPAGGWGVEIDAVGRGFRPEEIGDPPMGEAICGADDAEWAPCYVDSEPEIYEKSRAVARLLINSGGWAWWCTGWLAGWDGHLMTNQHCVENQTQAYGMNVEFMAEGATCDTNCASPQGGLCPGSTAAVWGTFIHGSYDYDYAIIKLPVDPSDTYGWFRIRPGGPIIDERIYLPNHSAGYGKLIAIYSDAYHDQSGYTEVHRLDWGGCSPPGDPPRPGPDFTYFSDSLGGSSGSPVIGFSDHEVVGLHHCSYATCTIASPNLGVPSHLVIADAGDHLPPGVLYGIFGDGFENAGTGSWSSAVP